jgi:ABC-type amino acid transport substrate-binding protein
VALAKGDSALHRLLDEAVADMHANGVFERIQRRWFGYDVRDLTAVLQARQRAAGE